MISRNTILLTDAYKLTHWKQMPVGMTRLFSYGEPRVGGKYPFISFFGMRMIVEDYFLSQVTTQMIDEAEEASFYAFGTKTYFNRPVWEKVRNLEYLPIRIKAVPEGTKLPIDNVAFTLESTEPWFATTLNALESALMHVWYTSTISTRAMYIKEALKLHFKESSEHPDIAIEFAVNDFGFRGTTGDQAAERGGAAFLTHFMGSDNMAAMRALKYHYDAEPGRLKSVWATEHSVATSYGLELENEKEYLIAQINRSAPDSIISVVIDSKDSDNFIKEVVGNSHIKEMIRKRPGRVVLRPDSGDPLRNILKYLDMLGGIFGYHINKTKTGYKTVNDNVGLIQGDGMDENTIPELYKEVIKAGWSADNFVTGSGGGLLQIDANRDTSRWAIKASYGEKDGKGFNIQKDPKTDPTKKSKTGLLKLHPHFNTLSTISSAEHSDPAFRGYLDALEPVLENGKFYKENFNNILKRVNA